MASTTPVPMVRLLITDLDNTLWDWFTIWYESFRVLLDEVARLSGVPTTVLEDEIRPVHQLRGTSEYAYLLAELPSLRRLHPDEDLSIVYGEAIHKFRSVRKAHTVLYPGVRDTLSAIKAAGVPLIAYTESLSYYTESRIKALGLDGVIDVLYSSPDHDFPKGVSAGSLRKLPDTSYGLHKTEHRHVPRGVLKPEPLILEEILKEFGELPENAVYVGDSLMKDVAMAQAVGVRDVLAGYGAAHGKQEYELLRRVTHWTQADVEREREIAARPHVTPSYTLRDSFAELLQLFKFGGTG